MWLELMAKPAQISAALMIIPFLFICLHVQGMHEYPANLTIDSISLARSITFYLKSWFLFKDMLLSKAYIKFVILIFHVNSFPCYQIWCLTRCNKLFVLSFWQITCPWLFYCTQWYMFALYVYRINGSRHHKRHPGTIQDEDFTDALFAPDNWIEAVRPVPLLSREQWHELSRCDVLL